MGFQERARGKRTVQKDFEAEDGGRNGCREKEKEKKANERGYDEK